MSQFAMRHLVLIFLMFSALGSVAARAQELSSQLYEIPDVGVDVTAKNAAQARDQAIVEAQHRAFDELMVRLGVNNGFAQAVTDDTIAPLVQNFEVVNERTSSVRYIGTFLIHFKPTAVRTFLGQAHVSFSEDRSQPYVIVPIYNGNDHPILWEEQTSWHQAWDRSHTDNGVVPIIVPHGSLDDLAVLNTKDALDRRAAALQAIIEKYQAAGVVIATLKTSLDDPKDQLLADIERFDQDGKPDTLEHLAVPVTENKANIDRNLGQLVTKIRAQLDKDWRQEARSPSDAVLTISGTTDPTGSAQTSLSHAPEIASPQQTVHLQVTLAINNLADWASVRQKLEGVPSIVKTSVISLQRDLTSIDLEFRGTTQDLQQDVGRQGLALTLNNSTGGWMIQKAPVGHF